jgi:ubiquitin conjugation factor E4 B
MQSFSSGTTPSPLLSPPGLSATLIQKGHIQSLPWSLYLTFPFLFPSSCFCRRLPLPKDVPLDFRVLPEYILEDIIDYLFFAVRHGPASLELTGKEEVLIFTLTFMLSTWWIKNPFLKNKIIDILFCACFSYRGQTSLLGSLLNSHPVALKYLMPALTHFYIEVEQTGASSQFYDKFNARRSIAFVLKAVWGNPAHREALKKETQQCASILSRLLTLVLRLLEKHRQVCSIRQPHDQ